jgi:polar amino acid transport system substrate-binding protein
MLCIDLERLLSKICRVHQSKHICMMHSFLFILFISGFTPSTSQSETLIIGLSEETHEFDNSSTRVLEGAFENLPYDLQWSVEPMARSIVAANRGELDGDYFRQPGAVKNFNNLIQVPTPIRVLSYWYVTDKNNVCPNPSDFAKSSMVGLLGAMFFYEVEKTLNIKINFADSLKSMMLMIKNQRVDATVLSAHSIPIFEQRYDVQLKTCGEKPIFVKSVFLYLHKKHAAKVKDIGKAIREYLQGL